TDRVPYDCAVVALLPDTTYDLETLRKSGDVVVNLISDIDRDGDTLPLAADLSERLGRPVINRPRLIRETGRDQIAARLSGIPGCRIPKTQRFAAAALAESLTHLALPFLIRPTGDHGGEAFEKIDQIDTVADFAARHPASHYYVTEYVDFSGADGYFRKYRLIFVDGEILPYHLAIDRQWKVHHFRTDMANQEWMRQEEEVFLATPGRVFNPSRMEALKAIRSTIGLDYFGIDCAIDREGQLVVFEVNATMLVHGEYGLFAYKQPYIERIKAAFGTMLAKVARASKAPV
ncbi:MAG TPA: hypothetical protein VGG27_16065, partial [Magnetospirillaceae bacterium]